MFFFLESHHINFFAKTFSLGLQYHIFLEISNSDKIQQKFYQTALAILSFIPDEFQLILMGLTVTTTRWSTCCFKLKTFHKKVMPYSEFSHFLLNCFGMRTMHSAKAKALSGEFSVRQAHREVVKIKEIFFLLGFSLEVHLEPQDKIKPRRIEHL